MELDIEIHMMIEAIERKYGYGFKDYSFVHIKRRVQNALKAFEISNVSALTHKLIYDDCFFFELLQFFSVNVTEMYRDPEFYKAIRKEVVPILKTYPFIKIWHAGCATGEEVYSMAILLKEEGLYDRAQIYATDFNKVVLEKAENGIYPVELLKNYTENYHAAGGKKPFSDYFKARYDAVIFDKSLKKNIVFAAHNLVTDSGFGDMNIIICRNVMIYFNKNLQTKVVNLFTDSLVHKGFLCLGSKESLEYSPGFVNFNTVHKEQKIYTKTLMDAE